MTQELKQLVETKIYTINDTEFYELLPQEVLALETLSKTKSKADLYTGIMPIEVDTILKLAKPVMWSIGVWEVIATPDPFLVGIVPSKVYFSNVPTKLKRKFRPYESFSLDIAKGFMQEFGLKTEDFGISSVDGPIRYYLLAQWGRELKNLPDLVKIAKEKYLNKYRHEYTKQKLEAEKNLAMLELDAEEKFGVIY